MTQRNAPLQEGPRDVGKMGYFCKEVEFLGPMSFSTEVRGPDHAAAGQQDPDANGRGHQAELTWQEAKFTIGSDRYQWAKPQTFCAAPASVPDHEAEGLQTRFPVNFGVRVRLAARPSDLPLHGSRRTPAVLPPYSRRAARVPPRTWLMANSSPGD
ncbi:hypothetical protein ACWGCW_24335 [Streptomyces sp. NPDC054933]